MCERESVHTHILLLFYEHELECAKIFDKKVLGKFFYEHGKFFYEHFFL